MSGKQEQRWLEVHLQGCFRGSAGSVAKIIGDYRTLHQCTQCQQGAGHWGQQLGILKQLLLCLGAPLSTSEPSCHDDPCSWERSSGRCWRNHENRCYACKRSRENANRCEKCCKKRFLSSVFPPRFTGSYTVNTGPGTSASYRRERYTLNLFLPPFICDNPFSSEARFHLHT